MRLTCLFLALVVVAGLVSLRAQDQNGVIDEKFFRSLEEERLRGLVDGNAESFDKFHAKEYELISPVGMPFSYDSYRKAITSGQLDYIKWEIGSEFKARVHGDVTVIRYQARLEFAWAGKKQNPANVWHTDVYEKRGDRWMVIWSQATQIF